MITLEKMGDFFDSRLDIYEDHQLNTITSAREFYPFTARCLPRDPGSSILDLGCGTGLELGYYYEIVPTAKVTGIDLPFEENAFDAAVSVESLHLFGRGPEQVGAALYAEGGQIMTDPAKPAAPAGI